jgi:NADPH-dependent 2,4-dienoyl-CoA reductase/sulfur reductase-like enzyme
MVKRLLVIGGDAAGTTAASTALRLAGDALEVVVLERGSYTSYSACGIPYWIAGDVDDVDALVARTPQEHREQGIDVRMGAEAVAIDTAAHTVRVRDGHGEDDVAYDFLLLATGAEPVRPPLPGIDADGILGVQSLDDGVRVQEALARRPAEVVVVGSGYVGLEMAEACVRRGFSVTVIERAEHAMPLLDPDLGDRIAGAMEDLGIRVVTGAEVTGFRTSDGRVTGVETDARTYDAELVVLGLGVEARTGLAAEAGLPLGVKGGLVVDERQRVPGHDDVWAAGDCALTRDRLTGELIHLPLGTHASKQGLVAGHSIASCVTGHDSGTYFPGALRTAISKICATELALTGLREDAARKAGFDPVVATIDTTTVAGYQPEAEEMTVRVVADRTSRRLLGAQIVGGTGSAWRIDTFAMALWSTLTVDELLMTDLAYAPPFSSVWDPVQVAARAAVRELRTRV